MRTATIALCAALLLTACGGDEGSTRSAPPPRTPPDRVIVDHILIGVKGPRIPNGKTPEAARELAEALFEQLGSGADWATLKQTHSDDPPPGGPYTMITSGQPDHRSSVFLRGEMAKSFGDVSFGLEVGEMGLAEYHPRDCKFGYHIIKRVE